MLNLPALHTYLTQLLSPTDAIHTALLLTPEGAVVSFACSLIASSSGSGDRSSSQGNVTRPPASSSTNGHMTPPHALNANAHTTPPQVRTSPKPNAQGSATLPHVLPCTASSKCGGTSNTPTLQRSKDDVWILAGLSAELWAETRGEGDGTGMEMGMVESEVRVVAFFAVFTCMALFEDFLLMDNNHSSCYTKILCMNVN